MTELFKVNIEDATLQNTYYRKVLYTTENLQVVVMSLLPNETIDKEIHEHSDQLFRIERGTCKVTTYDSENNILSSVLLNENDISVVPKNTYHEVVNIGNDTLKMYTIYAPKHHSPKKVNVTKCDSLKNELLEMDKVDPLDKKRDQLVNEILKQCLGH